MFFIRLPESGTKVIQLSICNKIKSINIGLNPINSSFFVCNFDIRCVRKQFGLNKLFLFFFFFFIQVMFFQILQSFFIGDKMNDQINEKV